MQKIGPDQLGKRLSIRLSDFDGGFRDLIGIYIAEDTIEDRNGDVITFSSKDIFVWKEIRA